MRNRREFGERRRESAKSDGTRTESGENPPETAGRGTGTRRESAGSGGRGTESGGNLRKTACGGDIGCSGEAREMARNGGK